MSREQSMWVDYKKMVYFSTCKLYLKRGHHLEYGIAPSKIVNLLWPARHACYNSFAEKEKSNGVSDPTYSIS